MEASENRTDAEVIAKATHDAIRATFQDDHRKLSGLHLVDFEDLPDHERAALIRAHEHLLDTGAVVPGEVA
jgi:hypothetical protein